MQVLIIDLITMIVLEQLKPQAQRLECPACQLTHNLTAI